MLHRALPKGPCWEALLGWTGQGKQLTKCLGYAGQSWERLVTHAPTTTGHHTTMVVQWQKLLVETMAEPCSWKCGAT